MANQIDIILQARDNASAALADFQRKSQGAREEGTKFGAALGDATRTARGFAASIAGEINPLLGQTTGHLLALTGHAARFSVGMGAATVALGAGAAALTLFVQRSREAAESAVRFNVSGLTRNVADFDAIMTESIKTIATWTQGLKDMHGGVQSPGDAIRQLAGSFTVLTTNVDQARTNLAKAREEFVRFYAVTAGVQAAQGAGALASAQGAAALSRAGILTSIGAVPGAFAGPEEAAVQATIAQATAQAQVLAGSDEQLKILIAKLGNLGEMNSQTRQLAEAELAAVAGGTRNQILAVFTQRDTQIAAIRERFRQIQQGFFEQQNKGVATESGQGLEQVSAGVTPEVLAAGLARREREAIERLTGSFEGLEVGQGAEATGAGPTPAEIAEGRKRTLEDEVRILDLRRQNVDLAQAALGTSQEQQAALTLESIELQRQIDLKLAGQDLDRRALADLKANIGRDSVLRREAERTDPIAGSNRALQDLEAEYGAAGLRMQSFWRNTAGSIAGAFDDGLFSVLTGKFKALPDVAKQFGNDMVRALTGELSKLMTAPILGQIRGLFGGGSVGQGPFGEGFSLGGLLPVGATGTLVSPGGQYLSGSDVGAAYRAAGDEGVRTLQAGRATVAGGQYLPDLSPEFTQSAYALARPGPTFFQRFLPVAGSAAALGLTAYGASQNTTDVGIGVNAAIGGLTGATLGASLATALPALGVSANAGGAYGAVAGAVIAGLLAYFGKQQADKAAKEQRQLAEIQRATAGGGDLVQAASGAGSLPELFDVITSFGSGYTGGTSPVAVSTTVETPRGRLPVGNPNPTYQVATLADLLANPESLQANIQAGVNPADLAGPNAATSAGLQAITKRLVDQYNDQAQGVGVSQQEVLTGPGGELRRRTEVPATLASRFAGTDFDVEAAGLAGLDEATIQTLYGQLVQYDRNQGFGRIVRDENDLIVSVTLAPPPGLVVPGVTPPGSITPPPGVPPEAIPAIGAAAALNLPQFTEAPPRGPAQYNAPLYDYVQSGEGGTYVQQPGNTGPITGYDAPSAEQMAAYHGRRLDTYAATLNQLTPEQRAQLAALTPAQIDALLRSGTLRAEQVASLTAAGIFPLLTQEILAKLEAAAAEGSPGGEGGTPGVSFDAASQNAALAGLGGLAALSSAGRSFGSQLGMGSPTGTAFASGLGILGSIANLFGANLNTTPQGSLAVNILSSLLTSGLNPVLGWFITAMAQGAYGYAAQTLANNYIASLPHTGAAGADDDPSLANLANWASAMQAMYGDPSAPGPGQAGVPGFTVDSEGHVYGLLSGVQVDTDPNSPTYGQPIGATTGNPAPSQSDFGSGEATGNPGGTPGPGGTSSDSGQSP